MRRSSAAVVNAFGPALHGARRGPSCTVPEPEELWFAAVAAAVPFRRSLACVTPPSDVASAAVAKRAGVHFTRVVRTPLFTPAPKTETHAIAAGLPPGAAPGALALPDNVAAAMARSPFQRAPDGEFDAVCFAGGALAHTIRAGVAAHQLSEAHRVLKPHGVVVVMGQRRGRLIGAPELQEDFAAMTRQLVDDGADVAEDSEQVGHADVYLPFANVQRRWFTSEYDVPAAAIADYVRSWRCYHEASAPSMDPADGAAAAPRGVRRAIGADPLEAMLSSIAARRLPTLRLAVDHFVVTCDNRPINRPSAVGTGANAGFVDR
jgi:SAM-dependent methyltransferase